MKIKIEIKLREKKNYIERKRTEGRKKAKQLKE
jgi:hypothetical protein